MTTRTVPASFRRSVSVSQHEKKVEKKPNSRRSIVSVVILAELVCAVVFSFAIFSTSMSHIINNRVEAISADLGSFDREQISAAVKPAYRASYERITHEMNETVWVTETVNYRKGPSTSYKVAGTLNQYASATRTGKTYNKWSRLRINGKDYYVRSKRLTTEQPIILDGGQKGEYERFALQHLADYGWDDSEIYPLINLWNRESGWNPNSHNRGSGAHGIPQALPASKMAAYGSDYYTNGNTQILWGLNYIATRYGSPSNAWGHFQSSGWY